MRVNKEEIIERLRADNRAKVSRETGLKYRYLRNLISGDIGDPGSTRLDLLRSYYLSRDVKEARQ